MPTPRSRGCRLRAARRAEPSAASLRVFQLIELAFGLRVLRVELHRACQTLERPVLVVLLLLDLCQRGVRPAREGEVFEIQPEPDGLILGRSRALGERDERGFTEVVRLRPKVLLPQ